MESGGGNWNDQTKQVAKEQERSPPVHQTASDLQSFKMHLEVLLLQRTLILRIRVIHRQGSLRKCENGPEFKEDGESESLTCVRPHLTCDMRLFPKKIHCPSALSLRHF